MRGAFDVGTALHTKKGPATSERKEGEEEEGKKEGKKRDGGNNSPKCDCECLHPPPLTAGHDGVWGENDGGRAGEPMDNVEVNGVELGSFVCLVCLAVR